MATKILPSLLSANLLNLEEDLACLRGAGADALHIDVMDGHFVPNLTFGPALVRQLRQKTSFWLDVHLMIEPVDRLLEAFLCEAAHAVTFHIEAAKSPLETIETIHRAGCKVGLAVKPNTDIGMIEPFLTCIDSVLVMTVEPGFGGQSFLPSQVEKIRYLHQHLKPRRNPMLTIAVDGGVTTETLPLCKEAGAEAFIAGTALFGGGLPEIAFRFEQLQQVSRIE